MHPPDDQRRFAQVPVLQTLWDFYVAAANKVGLSKQEIGTQFELEYGVAWKLMPTAKPEWTNQRAKDMKAKHQEISLKVKREMLKLPEARAYIPTDEQGEIIRDEEKNT